MSKAKWVALTALLLLIAAAMFFIWRYIKPFPELTEELLSAHIKALGIVGPIFFIAFFVFKSIIFFPATVLCIMAGVLWGPTNGFLILQIALFISTTCEFLVARYVAKRKVAVFINKKWPSFNENIKNRGFFLVIAMRLVPNLPWEVQNIGYALTSISLPLYLFAATLGGLPLTYFLTWTGSKSASILFS